jgi:polyhydroxybutyrate depolymerase
MMSTTRLVALLAAAWLWLCTGCETKFMMAPASNTASSGSGPAIGPVSPVGSVGTVPSATAGVLAAPVATGSAGVLAATSGTGSAVSAGIGAAPSEFAGSLAAPSNAAGSGGASGGGTVPVAGTTASSNGGSAGAIAAGAQAPVMQACPATSTLKPGETTESIQIGSVTRTYILHVPASYTGKTPVPLILDWHGILLNSTIHRSLSGFAELSEREGFIVAFPEGTDTAWNIGKCCTSSRTVDDLGFAKGLVTKLSQQGCIDAKRVHSTGYSMGGGMSMFLACNATDVFASIATSAFDLQPEEDEPCKPSRPIALIDYRSTGDPIVAYAGAKDTIPPNGTATLVTFIGAVTTLMKWAGLNGCTGSAEALGNGCQTYSQCSAGTEVTLCTKQGGGHDLMDPAPAWEFLKRHPMP